MWGAYIAIPLVLWFYARKKEHVPFKHLFWLFGLFIVACGTGHFLTYVTTMAPMYRFEGAWKIFTGIASWATVGAIAFIAPRALAMRMPEELEEEIAQRRKAEEELLSSNETLARRTEELEAANKELEGFCYTVSHDLRTPLRGITANTGMLIEDAGERLDPASQARLKRLGMAARRISDLIDDLLAYSRLSNTQINLQDFDLSAVAEEVAAELSEHYDFEFDIQPNIRAKADASLVRLVLQNLMENACKYAHPDRKARIEVSTDAGTPLTVVSVKDNGIGFDPVYSHKLWQPFERLHGEEFEGTGIGLANVHRIVTRHGGSVWANSTPGNGSTFFFTLPAVF